MFCLELLKKQIGHRYWLPQEMPLRQHTLLRKAVRIFSCRAQSSLVFNCNLIGWCVLSGERFDRGLFRKIWSPTYKWNMRIDRPNHSTWQLRVFNYQRKKASDWKSFFGDTVLLQKLWGCGSDRQDGIQHRQPTQAGISWTFAKSGWRRWNYRWWIKLTDYYYEDVSDFCEKCHGWGLVQFARISDFVIEFRVPFDRTVWRQDVKN